MTKRADIRQAIDDLLDAVGKPSGLTVTRRAVRPKRASELPAIAIQSAVSLPLEEEDQDSSGLIRDYTLNLLHLVDATGKDPEGELDNLIEWSISQLAGDPTLGGLVVGMLEEETEWFADEQNEVFAGARVEITITHSTQLSEV